MSKSSRPYLPQGNETGIDTGLKDKRRALAADRFLTRLPLVTVTYLAKISVPPFAAMGVALGIPLVFGAAGLGLLTGRMIFDVRRTIAFFLLAGILLLMQAFGSTAFSLPSLALFLVLYSPYILRLHRVPRHAAGVARYFINTCLFIGGCGIVQYIAQFIVGAEIAFPVDNFVPSSYLLSLYNNQAVLEYGSATVRSNGVFMLEPSFFSQLMATGIVIEIAYKRRLWVLGFLATAILVSHSGTGLMLLSVCLAYEAVLQRRWQILVGIAVVGALVGVAELVEVSSMFDSFFKRLSEFGKPGSSGSMRFVEGFYMFEEYLWDNPDRAMFGYGAGTFARYALASKYLASEMFIFKVIFEFGIVGTLAFTMFLSYCLFAARGVPGSKIAVAMAILLGGLYTPLGHCLALTLVLWIDTSRLPLPSRHDPSTM